MVVISFGSKKDETRGLGFLIGRFNFQTRRGGSTLVPEAALIALAREGLPFRVEGLATYEETISPLRNAVAAPVQRRSARSRETQSAHIKRTA